jgi:hypothetical protein
MSLRNSEEIVKMLAWNIIQQIHNTSNNEDWMQIGPFPSEMRQELNPIFGEAFLHICGMIIIGSINDLKILFLDSNMHKLKISTPITIDELQSIVVIAIKYRIPIKDFCEGLEINWNVDNPMKDFLSKKY